MKLLIWPALGPGHGSGHIRRCVALCGDLGAYIFLPEDAKGKERQYSELAPLLEDIPGNRVITKFKDLETSSWDLIILDRRLSDRETIIKLVSRYEVMGIDEGGGYARTVLPYIVDTLPLPGRFRKANFASHALLTLPLFGVSKILDFKSNGIRKVLVTFGGEDREGLGLRFLRWLKRKPYLAHAEITRIRGVFDGEMRETSSSFDGDSFERRIRVSPEIPDLKSLLGAYDLVITKFGLTAYEAAQSGCAVLLLNPGRYHKRLSRIAGFPEIGVRRVRTRSCLKYLKEMTDNPQAFAQRLEPLRVEKPDNLANFIRSLETPARAPSCPACGKAVNPVLRRYKEKTYCFCTRCGIVYRLRYAGSVSDYGEEYFFDSYKQQYGKTYLEDFEHISAMAGPRLDVIGSLLRVPGRRLLDVGCAYGPFLKVSRERGYNPEGLDVSAVAAEYVRNSLQLPVQTGDFATADPYPPGSFDVITMWYVLEHFEDIGAVLLRVNRLLAPGGIFGFSTPNFIGISGVLNPESFFNRSPIDHATVLSPCGIRRILKLFGFRLRKVRVTGQHPERFPLDTAALFRIILLFLAVRLIPGTLIVRSILQRRALKTSKKPILETGNAAFSAGMGGTLSKLLRMGDTFEVYAVKTRELEKA